MDTEKPKIDSSPVPLPEGLTRLREFIQEGFSKQGELVVVIHGPMAAGKSVLATTLEHSDLGKALGTEIIMPEDYEELTYNLESESGKHQESIELSQGKFPEIAKGKILVTTMRGNALWLKERFSKDPRYLFIELVCNDSSIERNLYKRKVKMLMDWGDSEKEARVKALRETPIDMADDKEWFPPLESYPSSLRIDTSDRFRISIEEMEQILSN